MKLKSRWIKSHIAVAAMCFLVGEITNGQIPQTQPTIAMPVPGFVPMVRLPASTQPAAAPPMGWNSYDGYGDKVTEAEILTNAKAFAEKLKSFGRQYVVVDYRWYDPGAFNNDPNSRAGVDLTMDENGRLQPSPNRFPSPLMLGGDLTSADDWELALLTNDEVIAVNQDSLAEPAMRVFNHKGLEVWERNLADGRIAVGLFNRSEDAAMVWADWAALDLHGTYKERDLWQKQDLGAVDAKVELAIPAHGAGMVSLTKAN